MIDFPNIKPQTMKVGITANSKTFTSTFNNSISATKFAGSFLTLSVAYTALDSGPTYSLDEVDEMSAFLFELGGIAGTVKIPMFHRPGRPAKGNPVVSVSGQLGGELPTSGWSPNALVLKRGQFITINDELKMILKDTVSDAGGNSTLIFEPWLRSAPSIGEAIITQDPYGIFRLTDDENALDLVPMNGSVTLDFREAFYV